MLKTAQPISFVGIGIGLLCNSVKFFVDAKRQIVPNELFTESIFWFVLFLAGGIFAIGYAFGRAGKEHEPKTKNSRRVMK